MLIVSYPWVALHSALYDINDFGLVINGCFNMFGSLSATFKALSILYRLKLFKKILNTIEVLQDRFNVYQWSQDYVYTINKATLLSSGFYYVLLSLLFLLSFYGRLTNDPREWRTPIMDIYVINVTYSPNYEIAYVYEVITIYFVSSMVCFANVLIAAILLDMSVQFKIFNKHIKNTFENVLGATYEANKEPVGWSVLQQSVKDVVQRHTFLIQLMTDTETVCSLPIFIDVVANILIICFSGYYASVLPLFDSKALQSYFEIIFVTLSLFLVSYCGTQITEELASISNTCYDINFIGTDLRFQKALIFIMSRTQKPVRVTVGGFTALSISVFVAIIRNSYSMFMVLHNTNDNGQTQFGEIPWMLAVFKNSTFTFAASLIHPKMAMTVAHYVSVNSTYKVRAGEWNWNGNDTIAHQHRFTEKVIIHPNYTLRLLRNDIALLLLETPFTILPHISPICLPNPSIAYNPSDCIATGWGQGFQGIFQNVLRKVKLSVISNKLCTFKLRESKGPHFPVHESYICEHGYNHERTSIGDGGGPLVCSTVEDKNTYQQVGIISWQLPKPRRHDPNVSTNVTLFRDWILQVMDNNGLRTCI
ncbi:hypothetical protein FQR65_LT12586 [Abscondita terminalis]|nr:hypothetical protein FQR65_LT12586 [Abscondita terminalis]